MNKSGTYGGFATWVTGSIDFPFTFKAAPIVLASGNVGAQNSFVSYLRKPTTTNTAVELCASTSSASSQEVSVYLHVIGQWK